ncbi:MAG: hypothetical protein KME29_15835 [Calothrix sp. FI2-JRJ7]|jgi:hypothetical protein|nr:hypothetical protein [Calothrix sp. FI2-JRJ7]
MPWSLVYEAFLKLEKRKISQLLTMQRFTKLIANFLVLTAFSSPAFAQEKYGYPTIKSPETPNCYMITQGRIKLDLMRLCGQVSSVTQPIGATISNPTAGNGASSSVGNCQYSNQLDSAGRKCGGRAADQRPGGK